jgi:4,5-DOPA dioxygenase extradiol
MTSTDLMPSLFIAHGAPPLLEDAVWMSELAEWGKALPAPTAILMISAHWLDAPVTLGATTPQPLVYDFYGFPQKFYQLTYPSPGAPALAKRVTALLSQITTVANDPSRGLDHGAYIPLMPMYPDAKIPVLQMSIPTMEPKTLYQIGQALAPLRREGVLVVGSGFITHNLRAIDWRPGAPVPSWASDFDGWVTEKVSAQEVDALLDYKAKAPGVRMSLPTHEHFVPLFMAMGAASDAPGAVQYPISGFAFGSMTKRSVQFG